AGELGSDSFGLFLELQVARFELCTILLEARQVVGRRPQGLLLRQQEVARIAVLDVDHVAHLAQAADALQENDLHSWCSVAGYKVQVAGGDAPKRRPSLSAGSSRPATVSASAVYGPKRTSAA